MENQIPTPPLNTEAEVSPLIKKPSLLKKIIIVMVVFLVIDVLLIGAYLLYTRSGNVLTNQNIVSLPSPTEDPDQPKVKILSIAFIPVKDEALDMSIIDNTSGDYFMTPEQAKEKVIRLNDRIATDLENGTRYKDYLGNNSPPAIKYYFYNQIILYQNVPPSIKDYPGKTDVKLTDYYSILTKQDICKLVEEEGVNEVWLWTYQSKDRRGWKSNLSSIYGDVSISDLDQSDMPICDKSYTVYEYDYGKGITEAVEAHLRQFEVIFQNISLDIFWNKFVGFYTDPRDWSGNWEPYPVTSRRCGSPEWPPNARYQGDWTNTEAMESDCMTWSPDGTGQIQTVDCTLWSCNVQNYFGWWMQNIPGPDNGLTYNGNQLRNWWDFISNYNDAIKLKKDLIY